jgi:hypothetical protein
MTRIQKLCDSMEEQNIDKLVVDVNGTDVTVILHSFGLHFECPNMTDKLEQEIINYFSEEE